MIYGSRYISVNLKSELPATETVEKLLEKFAKFVKRQNYVPFTFMFL